MVQFLPQHCVLPLHQHLLTPHVRAVDLLPNALDQQVALLLENSDPFLPEQRRQSI